MTSSTPELAAYFLASRKDVVQLELMEITHSSFSQPYRFVRNHADGVTVKLSDDEPKVLFEYYPAKFAAKAARQDLDYAIQISLGDLGEVIPVEIDNVVALGGFREKPKIRYWVYRSDDLTAPIFGPVYLEGPTIDFDGTFSSINAQAPSLNTTKTGERYKIERFPMIRGFLK